MNTGSDFEKLNRNVDDEAYDIRIDRDGQWWHEGRPIKRQALAKLFSTVLRLDEQGDYWLITPAEKGRIKVDDVPFIIINFSYKNNELRLKTNLEHEVLVSGDHPIILKDNIPYVVVRDNLLARINRAVYYDLIELGHKKTGAIYIESAGATFCLGVYS